MSLETAKQNLKELGRELNLELAFEENHTCVLGIDNSFSLHVTYDFHTDRLFIYAPILDGLPREAAVRLRLYETLLSGAILGGQMGGGGIGVSPPEELVLMHIVFDLSYSTESGLLRRAVPKFVQHVETLRKTAREICEGIRS